jgi:hypothetical protein
VGIGSEAVYGRFAPRSTVMPLLVGIQGRPHRSVDSSVPPSVVMPAQAGIHVRPAGGRDVHGFCVAGSNVHGSPPSRGRRGLSCVVCMPAAGSHQPMDSRRPCPHAVMPAQAGTHGRPAGRKQRPWVRCRVARSNVPPVRNFAGDGTAQTAIRSRSSSADWRWPGSGPRRSPRRSRTGSTCWPHPARTRRWCGCRARGRGR